MLLAWADPRSCQNVISVYPVCLINVTHRWWPLFINIYNFIGFPQGLARLFTCCDRVRRGLCLRKCQNAFATKLSPSTFKELKTELSSWTNHTSIRTFLSKLNILTNCHLTGLHRTQMAKASLNCGRNFKNPGGNLNHWALYHHCWTSFVQPAGERTIVHPVKFLPKFFPPKNFLWALHQTWIDY